MSLPAVILVVMFKILPWSGLQLAFKKFSYAKGIWQSVGGTEQFVLDAIFNDEKVANLVTYGIERKLY